MNYPDSLKVLIDSFKKLPSIGEKNAERLSFAVMNMSEEDINSFSKAIVDVKLKIKKCSCCRLVLTDWQLRMVSLII